MAVRHLGLISKYSHSKYSQITILTTYRIKRVKRKSLQQISRRLIEPLLRYSDLTVIKMAAVRHLGF